MLYWTRDAPRGPVGLIPVAFVALAVIAGTTTDARILRVTTVAWEDATGNSGEMVFQGTIDDSGGLSGRAYADPYEFVITGTVSATGGLSGVLYDAEETEIGDVSGQLNQAGELEGTLVIDGVIECDWVTPAGQLP